MNRGYIIPIGGAEAKLRDRSILRRFVELCGLGEHLVIIPTASQLPDIGDQYEEIFRDLGAGQVDILDYEQRSDCSREDWLALLRQAKGVFFTGGNQLRLSTTLGGTEVADLLRERNSGDGLHVAGTSAGASFMSEHMIAYGVEGAIPRSDMVRLVPGLGLSHLAIIDQHFSQRNRLGRLLTALAYNPRPIGIGLDEDTAAFIGPDDRLEVCGSGALTIVDPSEVEHSTMDSAKEHDPVCMVGLKLHVLISGASYSIPDRVARPPEGLGKLDPHEDSR